jgi:hypothetical protein
MTKGGRRKGAGRRPKPVDEKRVAILVRVEPEIRRQLEREAASNRRTLSREVSLRLQQSLNFHRSMQLKFGNDEGLARLVAMAATGIDLTTGKRWQTDAFAGQALLACVSFLLRERIPSEPAVVPEEVERRAKAFARAANLPRDRVEFERSPEGVGSSVAKSVLYQLETAQGVVDERRPDNVKIADTFRRMKRTKVLLSGEKS